MTTLFLAANHFSPGLPILFSYLTVYFIFHIIFPHTMSLPYLLGLLFSSVSLDPSTYTPGCKLPKAQESVYLVY